MTVTTALLLLALADAGAPPTNKPGPKPDPKLDATSAPRQEATPLRPAEAVLGDYTRAIGGEKAWNRHRSVYIKRQVQARGMEIGGTEERYATARGELLSVSTIAAMGTFRQGSDGKVRWSEDPINGLRILEGVEDEEARLDATWNSDVHLARTYRKVRSVPTPLPAPPGQRYECVELIAQVAPPAITCFDAATHLRVLQKGTHAGPQGAVPYLARFRDWRDVQGMKIPYSEETEAGALTMDAKVLEVKLDGTFDRKLFAVPRPPAPAP
jgi:hypothetical protein